MISSGLSTTVVLYRHGQLSAAVTQTFAFRIQTFIVIKTASQNSPSRLKGNPISRWFIGVSVISLMMVCFLKIIYVIQQYGLANIHFKKGKYPQEQY